MKETTMLEPVTNGGKETIEASTPYLIEVEIEGTSPILFHAWNCDAVEAKSKAAKGSKAKKTDDLESFIYRNESNEICIPGTYLRGAIINSAKFKQDPRSPRKSAMDLFKAGVVVLTEQASLGKTTWDFIHKCRVVIQKGSAVTRSLPAFLPGWRAKFQIEVLLPEYIEKSLLNEVIQNAGKLVGLGDFRPTYGRFQVIRFE